MYQILYIAVAFARLYEMVSNYTKIDIRQLINSCSLFAFGLDYYRFQLRGDLFFGDIP